MNDITQRESGVGLRSLRFLSGSHLKLLAVVTMLIDHVANTFLYDCDLLLFELAGRSLTLYAAMRYIGRLAFPIYAFLIVEGFRHTSSRRRYGRNLLVFALISEIPWNLIHSGELIHETQNVFFTLFFGFLGLCALEHRRGVEQTVMLVGLLLLSLGFGADYGASGLAFILLMYLLRDRAAAQAVIGCSILSSRWIAGLAFIPINMYNGKRGFIRGRFFKYAFYAIYPIHLLVLYLIKRYVL